MQKVDHLVALPGCCWKCRSSNREWYLDLELSIDYYGAVYICDQCVIEMCHIAEMLTKGEVDSIILHAKQMEQDNFDLMVKVSGLEQAIDGLRVAGSVSRVDPDANPTLFGEANYQAEPVREEPVVSGAGDDVEPLHDEGMDELSADDSEPSNEFRLNI